MLALRIAVTGRRQRRRGVEMAADDWVKIEDGPRGGKRYRHRKSGRVAYRPGVGDRRPAGGVEQRPRAEQSHVGHVPGKFRTRGDDRGDAERAWVMAEQVHNLMHPVTQSEGPALSEQEAIDKVAETLLKYRPAVFDLLRRKYGETRPGNKRTIARRLMAKMFDDFLERERQFHRGRRREEFFDQFED